MFENLKVLDGYDKDGEEIISDVDDDEFDGEGEGGELLDFIDPKKLTEEEKKALESQGIKILEGEGEGDIIVQVEGEGDAADESKEGKEVKEGKAGEKRAKEGDAEEGDHKRQKHSE